MGKKRKAVGRPYGHQELKEVNDADSKIKVNTYEDVADSEDEFHIQRDKVLLEDNPEKQRLRKWREDGESIETKSTKV